mmetsp:Transcript_40644/g.46370  ORF Transcript_40644/g.46370 Transcript_40644/m.46370 type:complete len:89 (+) Transcript_40644:251-517(+)
MVAPLDETFLQVTARHTDVPSSRHLAWASSMVENCRGVVPPAKSAVVRPEIRCCEIGAQVQAPFTSVDGTSRAVKRNDDNENFMVVLC